MPRTAQGARPSKDRPRVSSSGIARWSEVSLDNSGLVMLRSLRKPRWYFETVGTAAYLVADWLMKLTLYEAFEGLELHIATHNIGGLGIRRLLEGFHEEL